MYWPPPNTNIPRTADEGLLDARLSTNDNYSLPSDGQRLMEFYRYYPTKLLESASLNRLLSDNVQEEMEAARFRNDYIIPAE